MPPPLRLGVLVSHPIQYQAPLYRLLARRGDVALSVLYCDDHGVKPTLDREFGEVFQYDVPLLEGYEHRFLRNVAPRPGLRPAGLMNPEALSILRGGQLDALIVHGYNYLTTVAALLGPHGRTRVLLRSESQLLPRRRLAVRAAKQLALRPLFRRVDQFLAIGAASRDYFRAYGVPEERITVAPYSVDNAYFAERSAAARRDPAAVRRRLGLPERGPLFLFAAKLIAKKRPLDALAAFLRARDAGPCGLVYVGSGELRDELERAVAAAGAGDAVRLLGFRNQSELPEIYGACDVLVLPSDNEPWGLAVNEAFACGMAALVSDCVGAARDLISDQDCLFSPGDVERLGGAMRKIVAQPPLLQALKQTATARLSRWGLEQTAGGFVQGAQLALARRGR
jgi:glycosyltransferase involved in cell wall biosynthesis